MSLSRKRQRELNRLRSQAEDLLNEQRNVLGHAGNVAQEAGRQALHLNAEVVAPRVTRAVDQVRLFTVPFVTAALAGTVRSLERMENREAARQVKEFGEQRGLLVPAKKSGFGRILGIGAGVAAAAAVGYALYQAFRSDDELWVAPEQH